MTRCYDVSRGAQSAVRTIVTLSYTYTIHLATSANIETDRYHTFLHHRPGRSLIHCQVNLYFPPQTQPLRSQQGYNLHHLLLVRKGSHLL